MVKYKKSFKEEMEIVSRKKNKKNLGIKVNCCLNFLRREESPGSTEQEGS